MRSGMFIMFPATLSSFSESRLTIVFDSKPAGACRKTVEVGRSTTRQKCMQIFISGLARVGAVKLPGWSS